jgi:hypothetical protein
MTKHTDKTMTIERVSEPRIGASLPVGLLRDAYDKTFNAKPMRGKLTIRDRRAHAEEVAIELGHQILPGCDDTKILAIATRKATLRGYSDTGITYHDQDCEACGGSGDPCARSRTGCRGDGFAPPIEGEDR